MISATYSSLEDNSKGFQCEMCFRRYKYKRNLIMHQRMECGKEAQFSCPHCAYKAKHKGHLKSHMALKHLAALALQSIWKETQIVTLNLLNCLKLKWKTGDFKRSLNFLYYDVELPFSITHVFSEDTNLVMHQILSVAFFVLLGKKLKTHIKHFASCFEITF